MKYLKIILIIFVSFSIFGSMVIHSTSNNNPGGSFARTESAIVFFSKIPINSIKIIKCYLFKNISACEGLGGDEFTYIKHKNKKKGLTVFSNDPQHLEGYIIFSRYFKEKGKNLVHLYDIKNDKILHEWDPDIDEINKLSNFDRSQKNLEIDSNRKRYLFYHPILLDNGSIITHSSSPLIRIDRCSNLVWQIDKRFHHSLNFDFEKNIWSPTLEIPGNFKNIHDLYHDDRIAKISLDGKILYEKSITKILLENDLFGLISNVYYGDDPIHLNDIEPVNFDSDYWLKGDVFLSIRSLSLIMLYRPSTNKVIWFKQGPWRFQHDVDIINKNTIAIFDNNPSLGWDESPFNNNLYFYNFETGSSEKKYEELFVSSNINSRTGSLYRILENDDIYVEEENHGRILRGDNEGNLRWEFIWNSLINWSRYISEEEFKNLNFIGQKC